MRRQWSGAVRVDRRGERSVGTENRMRRQWSSMGLRLLGRAGPVGTEHRMGRQGGPLGGRLVVQGCCSRNGEQDAEAVEQQLGVFAVRELEVGTENRMRRQWSAEA